MIFYFSATGNNKYLAERIAAATGDYLVSITECVKSGRYGFAVQRGEAVGFVTPTYFWGASIHRAGLSWKANAFL